jgi:hypothetical protein
LKQSSSHALCMSSRRLTRGAPEYWEPDSQCRIRRIGPSLIGFIPFSKHNIKRLSV